MSRQARKNFGTSFFHVMSHGINDELIFKGNFKKKYFNFIQKYLTDDIQIIAYCIMTNHVHFIFYSKNILYISNFMKNLNSNFAKYYNIIEDRKGYVFMDRFKAQPIYSEKYLFRCINYVHNNPVKASIVSSSGEYQFSSYNEYINKKGITQNEVLRRVFVNENYFETLREYEDSFNENMSEEDLYMHYCIEEYLIKLTKKIEELDNNERNKLIIGLVNSNKISKKKIEEYFNISPWYLGKIMSRYT